MPVCKLRTSCGQLEDELSKIDQFWHGLISKLLLSLNVQTPCTWTFSSNFFYILQSPSDSNVSFLSDQCLLESEISKRCFRIVWCNFIFSRSDDRNSNLSHLHSHLSPMSLQCLPHFSVMSHWKSRAPNSIQHVWLVARRITKKIYCLL